MNFESLAHSYITTSGRLIGVFGQVSSTVNPALFFSSTRHLRDHRFLLGIVRCFFTSHTCGRSKNLWKPVKMAPFNAYRGSCSHLTVADTVSGWDSSTTLWFSIFPCRFLKLYLAHPQGIVENNHKNITNIEYWFEIGSLEHTTKLTSTCVWCRNDSMVQSLAQM